ncbi:MAG: High-affinity branched-chain amino acid transport system permease protein livh [Deltaproteobacteria bacterium]|nr:High-affinity branched-chain amino acid transport system permease protein livh [Deltaproteobacteria bacterium]
MLILEILLGGLLTGGIYALLAAGFSLQYGVARVLNVSHGEFIMLGALSTYSLYVTLGINPLLSLVIVGPVLFPIGFLLNKLLFQRIRALAGSREIFEGWSMLVSFGLLFIIQNIALLGWSADQKGYSFMAFPINLIGLRIPANRLVALLLAVAIGISFFLFLMRTRLGRAIRAASQEETGAQLIGINIRWMHGLCFGFGTALAGLAGVLISTMFTVSPFIGLPYTIIAIIVVVLGGLGNIIGSLVGGLILGLISSIVLRIEPSLEMVVLYVLFMLMLLIRPRGLFGK